MFTLHHLIVSETAYSQKFSEDNQFPFIISDQYRKKNKFKSFSYSRNFCKLPTVCKTVLDGEDMQYAAHTYFVLKP